MPAKDFLFDHHIVNGVYPIADAFDTSKTSDFVSMSNYRRLTGIIHTGVATGGTANGTVTVLASAVAAGSSTTAIPFKYRVCASSTSVDTWGAMTDATASGFSMTAGSNYMYEIEVAAEDVEFNAAGKPFVAIKVTESTNDPVVGGIILILSDPRYLQAVPVTAIA